MSMISERDETQQRFDRLLKAMSEGEPHKAEKHSQKPPPQDADKKRAPNG